MNKKNIIFFSFAFIAILFSVSLSLYGLMSSLLNAEFDADDVEKAIYHYQARLYDHERIIATDERLDQEMHLRIDDKINREMAVIEGDLRKGESIPLDFYESEHVTYNMVAADEFEKFLIEHFKFEEEVKNTGSFYIVENFESKKIYYDYMGSTWNFLVAEVNVSKFVEEVRSIYPKPEKIVEEPFYIISNDLQLVFAEGQSQIHYLDFALEKIDSDDKKTIVKEGLVHYTIDSVNLIIGYDEHNDGFNVIEVERSERDSSILSHTIAILSYAAIILVGVIIFALKKGLF